MTTPIAVKNWFTNVSWTIPSWNIWNDQSRFYSVRNIGCRESCSRLAPRYTGSKSILNAQVAELADALG